MPATFPSPQAIIPEFDPISTVYAVNIARRVHINPPRIITLTGNSDLVFDARAGNQFGDKKVIATLTLTLLGSNACKYALNMECGDDDGTYHGILPVQFAQVDLSSDQPEFVTVKGVLSDKVMVFISYPKESEPI